MNLRQTYDVKKGTHRVNIQAVGLLDVNTITFSSCDWLLFLITIIL